MTLLALQACVLTGERVTGVREVIEFGVQPVCRGVAGSAVVRKSRLCVARIVGASVVSLVARVTCRRCPFVFAVDVACRTFERRMHTR